MISNLKEYKLAISLLLYYYYYYYIRNVIINIIGYLIQFSDVNILLIGLIESVKGPLKQLTQ